MGLRDSVIEMSAEEICDRGEVWRKTLADTLKNLESGTTVYINVISGEFVAGATWHLARTAFKDKFGQTAFGYSFTVDRPIFLGGGIWLD